MFRLACRRVWISSKEHLNVNFNPASLLSFGDLLEFVNSVLSVVPSIPSLGLSPSNSTASINTLVRQGKWSAPEAAPAMSEQLAVEDNITARVPQKYLIQNQSGMRVFYWAERVSGCLSQPAGVSCKSQMQTVLDQHLGSCHPLGVNISFPVHHVNHETYLQSDQSLSGDAHCSQAPEPLLHLFSTCRFLIFMGRRYFAWSKHHSVRTRH